MLKKGLFFTGVAILLAGCGGSGEENASEEDNVVKIASHLPPMTDVVEIAADAIEEPYQIELDEVSDTNLYHEALLNEAVDANCAQHEPFMEVFNDEKDGNLVALQPIYNAIVGYYSPVYASIEDIEDGAEVAIPADATNEARALMILEQHDLI